MTVARVGLAAVAVAVVLWTAVLIRDARLVRDPAAAARAGIAPATAARAAQDLHRAGLLNPDAGLDVARGRFELLAGRPAEALRLGRAVARDEPDNVDAWVVVYAAAGALQDRPTAERAVSEIRRIDRFAGRSR